MFWYKCIASSVLAVTCVADPMNKGKPQFVLINNKVDEEASSYGLVEFIARLMFYKLLLTRMSVYEEWGRNLMVWSKRAVFQGAARSSCVVLPGVLIRPDIGFFGCASGKIRCPGYRWLLLKRLMYWILLLFAITIYKKIFCKAAVLHLKNCCTITTTQFSLPRNKVLE